MPNTGYIQKKTARNIIVGIFVFFMLTLGVGLQYVERVARDYAVKQALLVNNSTTCAFRALVDPPIAGYKRSVAIQTHIANDTSRNAKVRQTAKDNAASASKTLKGLVSFRNVYHTVPPGYTCPKPPGTKGHTPHG